MCQICELNVPRIVKTEEKEKKKNTIVWTIEKVPKRKMAYVNTLNCKCKNAKFTMSLPQYKNNRSQCKANIYLYLFLFFIWEMITVISKNESKMLLSACHEF